MIREVDIKRITPGLTTFEEVVALVGNADKEMEAFGMKYLLYRSEPGSYGAIAISEDNLVRLIAISPRDNRNVEEFKIENGEPEAVYFSNYAAGSRTVAYPKLGCTFVVSSGGIIAQAMYHESMTLGAYEVKLGQYFPNEDPFLGYKL
jgi:hypothetical protein